MKKSIFCFGFLAALLFFALSCAKSPLDSEPPKEDEGGLPLPEGIIWGSSYGAMPGETHPNAYARVKNAFDNHHIARIYNGADPVWPTYIPVETTVNISFKYHPTDVLDGSKDLVLANFFNRLATETTIYWTYFHEPEDEIRDGEFTAAEFRDAFDYIIDLSKQLNKPNLVPTLCLMAYSLNPASNRNWKDYLPEKVELISWDGYYADNYGDDVSKIFGPVREVMKTLDLPWAVAETGVNKRRNQGRINEDMDVEKRKRLLTALAKDLSTIEPLPVFVAYFDAAPPHDQPFSSWRISDDPATVAAWEAGQQ